MSNTGVFAPPHGVVFAPHLGGAEKKNFRYANLSPYLYLTLPPHFPNPRNIPGADWCSALLASFVSLPLPARRERPLESRG